MHLLEVLLAGADVALVAIRRHVYQFAQVSHSVGGQTERGVPDRRDVSVPQDARVCSDHKPNTGQRARMDSFSVFTANIHLNVCFSSDDSRPERKRDSFFFFYHADTQIKVIIVRNIKNKHVQKSLFF